MTDARPDHRPVAGRASLVVGIVAAVAAIGLATAAFWPAATSEDAVLDVTTVTAAAVPDTIPPEPDVPAREADDRQGRDGTPGDDGDDDDVGPPDPATAPPPTTEIERSPLADLLGVPGSAIPPAVEPRVRPASVTIDDIELSSPVRAVGLEDSGELEVPDETEIGWYRYGSSPGRAGATVLAAHVTWNGTIGPFFELGGLEPGARVDLALDDGTLRTYEVVERTMYDKDSLPRERIWRTTGDEMLVLITCGGSFNPDINRYRQNIVVYAVPVGVDRAGERATS